MSSFRSRVPSGVPSPAGRQRTPLLIAYTVLPGRVSDMGRPGLSKARDVSAGRPTAPPHRATGACAGTVAVVPTGPRSNPLPPGEGRTRATPAARGALGRHRSSPNRNGIATEPQPNRHALEGTCQSHARASPATTPPAGRTAAAQKAHRTYSHTSVSCTFRSGGKGFSEGHACPPSVWRGPCPTAGRRASWPLTGDAMKFTRRMCGGRVPPNSPPPAPCPLCVWRGQASPPHCRRASFAESPVGIFSLDSRPGSSDNPPWEIRRAEPGGRPQEGMRHGCRSQVRQAASRLVLRSQGLLHRAASALRSSRPAFSLSPGGELLYQLNPFFVPELRR